MASRKEYMGESSARWPGSDTIDRAFLIARRRHAGLTRKTDDTPYISHLMAVSALVAEHGGTEVQAAAALLHDVIEDTGMTHAEIEREVGRDVADIVLQCTDTADRKDKSTMTPEERRADWFDRKKIYLDHLAAKPSGTPSLLVVLADKTHNGEQTARDIERCIAEGRDLGEFFANFNAPREDQRWWYSSLLEQLTSKDWPSAALPLVDRFRRAVGVICAA